jgi:dihydropteroate synthase
MANIEGKENRQKFYADAIKNIDNFPKIMGILNVTPDSFYENSREQQVEQAISIGLQMWKDGATWIDIGGESTRPGADIVPVEEEIQRVIPVIVGLREHHPFGLISIDTRNPETARAALLAGADMVNDVTGLQNESMFELVLSMQCPVCIMHMRGEPKSMQSDVEYSDVVSEVNAFLKQKISRLVEGGFPLNLITVDPGIGFGKLLHHNIELLQAGASTKKTLKCSLLWGVSRKSMIGELTGNSKPSDRLAGTLGSAAFAMMEGIDILRVHDVKEHVDFLKVLSSLYNGNRQPLK